MPSVGRQVDLRKTVPGPFVGLEHDLAVEERIVGPYPVFKWLAWIGVNFERTAPHALPFLVQVNNKIQAAGGRNRPVELTIDRADLPNPGIDRLSPDGSVLGDRQFWIELGKLGEKPLRKRRLEKIGDHDVTERFSAEECPGSCPRGRVFRRTLLPNEPFWTASNFSSFVKTPEPALHLTGRWISATGHPHLAW